MSLTSAHIFVGNASNIATDVAMSGDATISNAGVVTIPTFSSIAKGLVPPSGGGTTNFLRADGNWTVPVGGLSPIANNRKLGNVSGVSAVPIANQIAFLHAKDFGAVGDNSTDDTTALQNWLNACRDANIPCWLDTGNYRITSALSITTGSITVTGAGLYFATIKLGSATMTGLDFNTAGKMAVSNIGIQPLSGVATAGHCLRLRSGSGPIVRQVRTDNCFNGITVDGSTGAVNFVIDRVDLGHCQSACLNLISPGDSIVANSITSAIAGATSIDISGNGGLRVTNNKITDGSRGVRYSSAADSVIFLIGNSIEGQTATGFEMNGGGTNPGFTHVQIIGNNIAGPQTPIWFTDTNWTNLRQAAISGNTIQCDGIAGSFGIRVSAGQVFTVGDNAIHSCATGIVFDTNTTLSLGGANVFNPDVTTQWINNGANNAFMAIVTTPPAYP